MKTFKHSGDMGDIVFSVPTIRALGGGILYLDPDGGQASALVANDSMEVIKGEATGRTKLNLAAIDALRPLLELQDCITQVAVWEGQPVDHDLDLFRNHVRFHNLCISSLAAFGLSPSLAFGKWLAVPTKRKLPRPYVISRSVRYHGNYTWWVGTLPKIKDKAVFVGYPKEHEIFEYTFGHAVTYYPTPTILDLAETINGCERLFCNQGLAHAIGEGLCHPLECEVFRPNPAAVFRGKPTSIYV